VGWLLIRQRFFGGCFRQRGPRRKWPSWSLALNPPLPLNPARGSGGALLAASAGSGAARAANVFLAYFAPKERISTQRYFNVFHTGMAVGQKEVAV